MRLLIKRCQAKDHAGSKFELQANTQLTPEEAELVQTYDLGKVVVLQKLQAPTTGRPMRLDLRIEDLVQGWRFECNNIPDMLETENSVKEACENFRGYLEVMENFIGEQVLEYPMTHVSPTGERVVEFDLGARSVRGSMYNRDRDEAR